MSLFQFIFLQLLLAFQILTTVNGLVGNDASCVIEKKEAKEGQFPHHLSLMRNGEPVCGATLVKLPHSSFQFALTAAHCLESERETESPISEYSLGAGSLSKQEPLQAVELTGRVVHENYTSKFLDGADIAILFFEEKFDLSVPTIKPIAINSFKNLSGASIYHSDWDISNETQTLRYAHVNTLPVETCQSRFYSSETEETIVCVAGDVVCGGDLCVGETGGPAITYQRNPSKRKYTPLLIGIVIRNLNCGVVGYPGVYINVANYYDWIQQKVSQQSSTVQY